MIIKKEITDELNRLKLFGFTIITMNDNRALRKQQKNFVDHLIFNTRYIVFVEVKIGNDKLSSEQENIMHKLSSCAVFNKYTFYKLISTKEEAKKLVDKLLQGKL